MTTVIDAGARVFVDGHFRNAVETQAVIEAATGEPLGNGSAATESEVDDAVAAARAALPGWAATPAAARDAGLPRGVLNIIAGGPVAGAYLVQHPGVDKVAFTGSTAAGRVIGEMCGRLIRPVTLELDGKSAAILDLQAPFGGVKASGIGRELGPEGLAAYQTLKSIYRVGPA
jgi:acyl-CoA reductase-like NAD-dependent aldehyde dehydrogenase